MQLTTRRIATGSIALLVDPAGLSSVLAKIRGNPELALARQLVEQAHVKIESIDAGDISDAERLRRARAVAERVRPALANTGLTWHSALVDSQ